MAAVAPEIEDRGLELLSVAAAARHALYLLYVLVVSFAVLTLEAQRDPAVYASMEGFEGGASGCNLERVAPVMPRRTV